VSYLDHNATTPLLPQVRDDVMLPYLTDEWANYETGVLYHGDAVQAVGKFPVTNSVEDIDTTLCELGMLVVSVAG
jgi:cysteine sulfinate desulfinase/cysteine desulfurase-like protein